MVSKTPIASRNPEVTGRWNVILRQSLWSGQLAYKVCFFAKIIRQAWSRLMHYFKYNCSKTEWTLVKNCSKSHPRSASFLDDPSVAQRLKKARTISDWATTGGSWITLCKGILKHNILLIYWSLNISCSLRFSKIKYLNIIVCVNITNWTKWMGLLQG